MEAERALEITPNLARGYAALGAALIFSGRPRQGITALEQFVRLDPRDPGLAARLFQMAVGLYFCRDYEASVRIAQRGIRLYPDHPLVYRLLAAALGQLGRIEEAKQVLEKAIAIAPTAFQSYVRKCPPWMRPEDHAHMLEGLRKAGWREE
jgi:adenylate cyclase